MALLPKDRNNLLFYVAMHMAACLTGVPEPTMSQLSKIKLDSITYDRVDGSFDAVKKEYEILGATDQIAKGTALLQKVKADLSTRFVNASGQIILL
jgi:hypothetical protein